MRDLRTFVNFENDDIVYLNNLNTFAGLKSIDRDDLH